MREIFSVRFFAAVGAVAALLFLLSTLFAARTVIDNATDGDGPAGLELHRIDLVERIESANTAVVGLDADGVTVGEVQLTIDASRAMRIVARHAGELACQPAAPGACAIVADLLGEAVVWFALVPMNESPTAVQLPAIDTIEEGLGDARQRVAAPVRTRTRPPVPRHAGQRAGVRLVPRVP